MLFDFLINDIDSKIYNCIRYSLKSCSIYKQFDNVKKYSYNTFSKFYFSLFYTPMIKLIQKYYLIIKRLFNNPTNFDVSKTSSIFFVIFILFLYFFGDGLLKWPVSASEHFLTKSSSISISKRESISICCMLINSLSISPFHQSCIFGFIFEANF